MVCLFWIKLLCSSGQLYLGYLNVMYKCNLWAGFSVQALLSSLFTWHFRGFNGALCKSHWTGILKFFSSSMNGAYTGWSEMANTIAVTKTRTAKSKQITEWNSEIICTRVHATRVISQVALSNILVDVISAHSAGRLSSSQHAKYTGLPLAP